MMSRVCSFLVIFSVISSVHCAVVKRTSCNEPTALNSTLIQAVVDVHNLYRSQAGAADMLKLEWSDRVASVAQNYANLCTLFPNSQCDPDGEMDHNSICVVNYPRPLVPDDILYFVELWVNGSLNYAGNCCSDTHCDFSCVDYKRVVWASTSEIGCGMNLCDSGLEGNFG